LKLWDISHRTYKQTVTLRHSSIAHAVDVSGDVCAISGHHDGGVRVWDLKTGGDRTANMEQLHEGGCTSVQFHPTNATQVLTSGKDSSLQVVDMRTGKVVKKYTHDEFRTTNTMTNAVWSPDGNYVASVSGLTVFVWNTAKGSLVKKLTGHQATASGIAWGSGGTNGQQVASIDQGGRLILWA